MRKILIVAALAAGTALPSIALAQNNTAGGAVGGAIAGGLIAGPPGAIAGAAIGGTVGAATDAGQQRQDRVIVEEQEVGVRERTCVEERDGRQVCTEVRR
jgi:hypothetical protein